MTVKRNLEPARRKTAAGHGTGPVLVTSDRPTPPPVHLDRNLEPRSTSM